jgi:hypothetical protein
MGRVRGLVAGLVPAVLVAGLGASSPLALSTSVVVSQVYGGGGNTAAPYANDYVELFNRGSATVSLSGWSLQYASAAGTGNLGASSGQLSELSGSLAPGQHLLVAEASGGAVGAPLPTPDLTDATPINMSATAGKVALVSTTTPLGCNGGSTPCPPAALATIVDLVGYGATANFFEGSGPAAAPSNTTAVLRSAAGCAETDDNAADFTAGAPNPRNTATASTPCLTDSAPAASSTSPANGASGVAVDAGLAITFSEPVDAAGAWFSISCARAARTRRRSPAVRRPSRSIRTRTSPAARPARRRSTPDRSPIRTRTTRPTRWRATSRSRSRPFCR